jgi:opacity protein-like surface antigen
MRKLSVVLLVSLSCSVPMLGQTDKGELFGGYSFERIAPGCGLNYRCGSETAGPATNLNGWIASLTGYFYKSLGLSAQFTGNYNGTAVLSYSTVHRYSYQFGPAYVFHVRKASAFAHALFGGVTQKSSPDKSISYTAFMWSVGGGLDFKASRRISIRPVQLDYERQRVPVVYTGGPTPLPPIGVNGLRYSAGIVLNF